MTPDERPYLVYTAGDVQTTPLVEVNEILQYPEVVTPLSQRSDGLVGLFHHRGAVVPLIHLSRYLGLGRPLVPEKARVLLMEEDGQHLGFIIDTLHSIEPAHWRTAAPDTATAATCERAMTLVGAKAVARLVWHQDLRALMRRILDLAAQVAPGGDEQQAEVLPEVA